MTDASWDNGGAAPSQKRMGTGLKVLLGCGVTVLVLMVTCVVSGVVLGRMVKNDPEGFAKRVEGWAKGAVKQDWERCRVLVDQLQTEEGTRAVYQANADLHEDYATEAQFCEAVRGWRPRLSPLPVAIPMQTEARHRRHQEGADTPKPPTGPDVSVNKMFGSTTLKYRYAEGTRLRVTLKGERIARLSVD